MSEQYKKTWYKSFVSLMKQYNRCISCKRHKSNTNKLRCTECSSYAARIKTRLYNDRKSKGLCTRCSIELGDSSYARCLKCRNELAEIDREYRKRRRQSNK